jgi:hypothetical protein
MEKYRVWREHHISVSSSSKRRRRPSMEATVSTEDLVAAVGQLSPGHGGVPGRGIGSSQGSGEVACPACMKNETTVSVRFVIAALKKLLKLVIATRLINLHICVLLQRAREMRDGLQFALQYMETASVDLKKLLEYVSVEVTGDDICFRLNDVIGLLDTGVEQSWSIYADNPPPLSNYWDDDR